ncbi:NADH dehydrogenase [Jannaschia pagri]|uniref:NADH:ubiquinone reductase (non-electrogenic) n=1 Tax=Jannaschia pagri TaxID=2829797 RepID=A0ABQ4NPL3_9RHOB|nr:MULTISPECIES: NAD(P)/FAD-dependent oxidoreductase [unclassified Jannaschia]GIT92518.1 NADH dehydrogenase [Jannaschia sp. AI_61]GIT96353.1 NADH dehydrogenase [Jannaschia sp. AI_62]
MKTAHQPIPDKRPHVVVVGGGFAGVQCIKSLRGAGARITLIDQRNHHLFQPLLYQAATTILAPSEIAWPLRQLFRDRQDVTTLMGRVTGVDTSKRCVLLKRGAPVSYDYLVLATGARHSYFGHDAWEAHAPGLKTLEDATRIRRKVLQAFEMAETEDDPEARAAHLTFAVIGAGPTGVELAGIIAELAHRILPRDFRRIDTRAARVLLIEAGPTVLSAFPEQLSAYARQSLAGLGVEVMTGDAVTGCSADAVMVGDRRIPCRTIIWAAGVQASPAASWVGASRDRAGRAFVGPDLSLASHPDIFVVGDAASVSDTAGQAVPGIAPAAKQMGAYVAAVIRARLGARGAPGPFVYRHAGNLATLGRRAAIADFGRVTLTGAVAWWVWGIAHIYFLIGTRSRFVVAWNWLWTFVTRQNAARLITMSDPRLPQAAPAGTERSKRSPASS